MALDLSGEVLNYIAEHGCADTLQLASLLKVDHQKVIGAVKSLQALGDVVQVEQQVQKKWELTDEGRTVVEKGSHEAIVYNSIPQGGILQSALINGVQAIKVGFSKAMSNGWIQVTKQGKDSLVKRKVDSITDTVQENLKRIVENKEAEVDETTKQDYRKRKLLQELVIKSYLVSRGKDFTTNIEKAETDLTMEMIVSGAWKENKFKPYNLDAMGVPPPSGHLHPLLRVRTEFRQIFLEMGFTEMPTNNFVENSFWNFDALFQPQQHPARDAHDTFFISDPKTSSRFPPDYLQKVKQVHSKGGYGSQGYGYEWKLEEAQKNLLRTHTTAVSARMLYLLAKEGFKPSKYFSIDRVFRNETLDATHLAEFHQVEGVIADYNLTLGDLIGTLYEFFKKLGITKLQFKPAYNPYTEPSMEVFCYHEGLGKWIEVGNSGIFRPEMLLPMGLPQNVNVIAWGLSLERPTMIKYGLNNIRDLVGAKVDLQMVHDSPLCRLDKTVEKAKNDVHEVQVLEQRWDSICQQLEELTCQLKELKSDRALPVDESEDLDIVIFADPQFPPFSAFVLIKLVAFRYKVNLSSQIHSSITSVPKGFSPIVNGPLNFCDSGNSLNVNFIWKKVGKAPVLVKCPLKCSNVVGEVNIARYLNRLLEMKPEPFVVYESNGEVHSSQIDLWLDIIDKSVNRGNSKVNSAAINSLASALIKREWLIGNSLTIADICLWSSLRQNLSLMNNNSHMKKWFVKGCQHFGQM